MTFPRIVSTHIFIPTIFLRFCIFQSYYFISFYCTGGSRYVPGGGGGGSQSGLGGEASDPFTGGGRYRPGGGGSGFSPSAGPARQGRAADPFTGELCSRDALCNNTWLNV